MKQVEPLAVRIGRGPHVESVHLVDVVVTTADAATLVAGEQGTAVIPRSAIKAIQALPLIASGAADDCLATPTEIALAASSHSGGADHVDGVLAWLDRLGLSEEHLECGADLPLGTAERDTFLRADRPPSPAYNCCSGKHAGFLATALHLGEPTAGYIARTHGVQQRVMGATSEVTGVNLDRLSHGIDGCGIPTFSLPLFGLALGMARLADPSTLDDRWAPAAHRLVQSCLGAAHWMSGDMRTEATIEGRATEPIVAKTGAEGVFTAILPERGLGVALKARDGAGRASDAAILAVLHHLGAIRQPAEPDPIVNKAGQPVGVITVHGLP